MLSCLAAVEHDPASNANSVVIPYLDFEVTREKKV